MIEESKVPFTLSEFVHRRPYLYHLTDSRNLDCIQETGVLDSAANLMRAARWEEFLYKKREDCIPIGLNRVTINLRDQKPLHAGNIEFESGIDLPRFIRMLNERVFFWPGKDSGPIDYGIRHFERYHEENPIILRVQTSALFAVPNNPSVEFCKYNSGSPRCSRGAKSPRGPSTFVPESIVTFSAAEVVEVTYRGRLRLPAYAEIGRKPDGPWRKLDAANRQNGEAL